jgi:hypothetical protein
MLSTSLRDAKAEDQTKSVVQPTLEKNDNIDIIKAELEKKVQSIQQVFESAWENSPLESKFSHICYLTSDEGAAASRGTQILSLLGKFKTYENVQQIKDDFWNLKAYCSKQCETNKVSQSFGDSYLVNLHLMEALFISAFMDNLSYVMQSIPISDPVLSVETESKVDFESIAERVKNSYEADLHDRLFADQSKTLISELLPAVVDINRQIDLYHKKRTKVFTVKPVKAKDNSSDVPQPIKQLLSDEVAYASLCISDDISTLKDKRQALIEDRRALLDAQNQQIDAFLSKIRAQVIPVQINCDAIPELSPLAAELRQAEAAISSINEQNRLSLLESDGVLRLKEIITANKELKGRSLQDVVKGMKPGFFTSDTKWTEKRNSIAEKLETMKSHVIRIVHDKISSLDFVRKREEIIIKEGDDLRKKIWPDKEILPIAAEELLKQRRADLDKQWEVLLASKDNIEILNGIPGQLFNASKELDPCVKKEVYIQAALNFKQKLAPYRKTAKKAAVSPEPKDAESKAQPKDQEDKQVLPVVNADAQGLEFVDHGVMRDPTRISLYGSIQYEDGERSNFKPKQHWYTKFVDKPWKRALLIGLGTFIVAGLAATGIGLLLEASLTVLLGVSLGGGAVAGLLMGGVTYACSSHGHEPPRQIAQVKPESATQKSDLIDRRRSIMSTASAPSVFPVYAPNVLSDPESTSCFDWFLRRRQEHRVDPPAQGVGNQPKKK